MGLRLLPYGVKSQLHLDVPGDLMTTKSKNEAFQLLEETRQFFIRYAQWLAVQFCAGEYATTVFRSAEAQRAVIENPCMFHAKLLRDEMEARGLFDGYAGSMTWVGAALRGPAFRPVPGMPEFCYAEDARNIHDKRLLWWEIANHGLAGTFVEPFEPESYAHARSTFRANNARAYGVNVHRELALEAALIAIREHALAHQKERETAQSGRPIELAPKPVLLKGQIEWLLEATALVA